MHLPSERVYKELRSEEVSLWIVPANDGEELALLIKAPSSAIKALIAGCPLNLIFGRKGSYLCAGAQIQDMPDAPMLISGCQRNEEEHQALLRLIKEKQTPVFLFNEMDVCLAWSDLKLNESDALQLVKLLHKEPAIYSGPFSPECSHALDCFVYSVDPAQTYPGATTIDLVTVQALLGPWCANNVSFVGFSESQTIIIDHQNEGEIFERAIWASLESVFPMTLYKSPQVQIGKNMRELTDILTFYKYGSFLIEAKDISVIQAGFGRDQERRTKGVQKQVKKAIVQLVGASKAITRGEKVFNSNGQELNIVRDKPLHCIILITELMNWGNWQEIETQLIDAIETTGAFFQLMDLREFITLLKISSGQAEIFDFNLMERCKSFVRCRSVHLRSRTHPRSINPTR